MSPNMLVVTTTSYFSGCVSTNIANASTIATSFSTSGYSAATSWKTSWNSRQPCSTLCFTTQVTRFLPSAGAPRPRSRASSNALRITRSDARRVITRRSVARLPSAARSPWPLYRPSVFSRIDHHVDLVGPPHLANWPEMPCLHAGQAFHGRTLA
jgi:hypothetical protein